MAYKVRFIHGLVARGFLESVIIVGDLNMLYNLKKLVTLFAILLLLFSTTSFSFAKSPKDYYLTPQKTLPGSIFYNLKRAKEKTLMFFSLTQESKFIYGQVLVANRLSELVSLVEQKSINHIPNASQRFAYQAGILSETHFKLKTKKKEQIIAQFGNHKITLSELRDEFPANSAYWLLIQQDIDTLNILSSDLK